LPSPRIGDPDRRLRLALIGALIVFIAFGARLFQLQAVDASALAAKALESRSATNTLPAHRGDIRDASGAVLATTVDRRNITVDQTLVAAFNESKKDLPAAQKGAAGAALVLSPVLGISRDELERRLDGKRRFAYLDKDVEPSVWAQVDRLRIPGIFGPAASRRTYPGGQVAASIIGFLSKDGIPLSGIEKTRNVVLQGTDGKLTYERGAKGQPIGTGLRQEVAPVPGNDIQLTINRDLQWKAQELLAKQVKAANAQSGTVVIMDTRSFDVLALADAPTFDSNRPSQASAADRENRALIDVFEPGSTSKVITAAAALEEGKAVPGTRVVVPGSLRRGGDVFHDSHPHGTLKLTLAGVMAQSSNIGTIKIGERMSSSTLHDYLTKFGYGSRTGVGLPESPGILTSVKDYSATTPYTVMFGQGVSVTALQAASVYATIANDGVRLTPRVIKAIGGPDGQLQPQPAGQATRVVSPKTAQKLRLMLESVVSDDGTAIKAAIPGYRVAGKTGTADFYDDKLGKYSGYTASFIGIAPADKPRLVIAVFLQQPKNGHYGGVLAAPVFQELMTYALAREGVAPTGAKAPRVPLDWR
jgi:cell division protein FtsI (penicillin-binding protein 3)